MFLEIIFAILIGVLAGTFSGLTPGIHTNLIAVIIVTLANELLNFFSLTQLITIIIAMSITHTFVSIIPSIYLGAPSADLILTALPGHQMLFEGRGHEAILLTILGGIVSLGISLLATPLILIALPKLSHMLDGKVGIILLTLIVILLLFEKKKILCFVFFITSGIFGILIFQLNMKQPLLALLSGCFGVSLLLMSLSSGVVPKQQNAEPKLIKNYIFASIVASIAGFFAAFLPGFGASQVSIYASKIVSNTKEVFLVLSGGVNTIAMFISCFTFVLLAKARNGSIVAISELTTISQTQLWLIVIICIISAFLAAYMTIKLSIVFQYFVTKLPYNFMVWSVIVLIVGLVLYFDTVLGLVVLALSTLVGISAQLFEIPKHYLLGSLILSVLFYFL
jgi:putative membrane protein